MKIVSWNILQGGGERASHISQQLRAWNPDVVGLCEFRGSDASRSIAATLFDMGLYYHHATVDPAKPESDRLLLASRWPLYVHRPEGVLASTGRWIEARIAGSRDLRFVLMWVPNRDEECTKRVFHQAALEALARLSGTATLAMGDTNTGVPDMDDHTGYFLAWEGKWLRDLESNGWSDLWRQRNPDLREYSWHHHNGAGFRIDQLFATRIVRENVRDLRYEWGAPPVGKRRGPSDHAAIIFDVEAEASPIGGA